jgi:hypothetical protein
MLPTQLPIVPVNLFVSNQLQNIPPSANAMRSGAGPSQHGRVRENGDLQGHQVGQPAELRRERPAQPI